MFKRGISSAGIGEVHITSLVLQAVPASVPDVAALLREIPGAEVHRGEDNGKLVVLLETNSLHDVTDGVESMRAVPDVINVTLVYHQIEDAALIDQPVASPLLPA